MKASLILTNARSAQMAQSLGLESPQSSARCAICHSPFAAVSQARLAQPEHRDMGVSCESCHGPAEPWLRSHTRRDYTYAMRVGSGLRDLRSIYVRANVCVTCHQVIEKDIAAAGHPPLFFELTTQLESEPPHWRELGDRPMRVWLTGQAVALRELSWNGNRGHSDNDDGQRAALAWLLAKVTAANKALPKIDEQAPLEATQHAADELARLASKQAPSDDGSNVMRLLSSTETDFMPAGARSDEIIYYRAKRTVLAFDALVSNPSSSPELRQLEGDVGSSSSFDSQTFGRHLEAFRLKLDSLRR